MPADLHLVRVARRVELAEGVVGLTLESVDGTLPPWAPGAHIDLVLPSGIVRQYSLCGPLGSDTYEIAVLHEPDGRGGSAEVYRAIGPGAELKIRSPRNRFPLEQSTEYLFFAGGIGITPLLPMIEAINQQALPWRLVYGGRSRSSMAFRDLLDPYDQVTIWPQDECGLIEVVSELTASPGAAVYACGPSPLIDAVGAAVDRAGRGPLHFERFVPVPVASGQEGAPSQAFEVQLGEDGPVVQVAPDQSVLDAVLGAGADVLFSCEEGSCGSCQTRVLSCSVDHRDDLLTEEERVAGEMLICVSRCLSDRLVLDIAL